jgi:hypothetical protein
VDVDAEVEVEEEEEAEAAAMEVESKVLVRAAIVIVGATMVLVSEGLTNSAKPKPLKRRGGVGGEPGGVSI